MAIVKQFSKGLEDGFASYFVFVIFFALLLKNSGSNVSVSTEEFFILASKRKAGDHSTIEIVELDAVLALL